MKEELCSCWSIALFLPLQKIIVQAKEYYSPEEVDRLSGRELDDPKIMERVMKSMTKWKK